MIIVRWCIPDMSPKLRDKIRREAYITNEIIIQHEAQRACMSPMTATDDEAEPHIITAKRVSEVDAAAGGSNHTNRWNRVLGNSLSAFDFDLEVHGSPMVPAAAPPRTGPVEL